MPSHVYITLDDQLLLEALPQNHCMPFCVNSLNGLVISDRRGKSLLRCCSKPNCLLKFGHCIEKSLEATDVYELDSNLTQHMKKQHS